MPDETLEKVYDALLPVILAFWGQHVSILRAMYMQAKSEAIAYQVLWLIASEAVPKPENKDDAIWRLVEMVKARSSTLSELAEKYIK